MQSPPPSASRGARGAGRRGAADRQSRETVGECVRRTIRRVLTGTKAHSSALAPTLGLMTIDIKMGMMSSDDSRALRPIRLVRVH